MDIKYLIVAFFVLVIILTLVCLLTGMPTQISLESSMLIVIFSLFVIASVLISRKRSYYSY